MGDRTKIQMPQRLNANTFCSSFLGGEDAHCIGWPVFAFFKLRDDRLLTWVQKTFFKEVQEVFKTKLGGRGTY